MRTPAFADALVSGLSTSPATANEILGDLAEEWTEHVDQDGPGRARRWYWGQALRAIPHLLHQWWFHSHWPAIVLALVAAVISMLLLRFVGAGTTLLLLHTLGEWQPLYPDPRWTLFVLMPVLLLAGAFTDFAVGALVAVVVRRAPVVVLAWMWVLVVATDVSFYIVPPTGNVGFSVGAWLIGKLVALPLMVAGAVLVLRSRDRVRTAI
jgi:hypothetical protein